MEDNFTSKLSSHRSLLDKIYSEKTTCPVHSSTHECKLMDNYSKIKEYRSDWLGSGSIHTDIYKIEPKGLNNPKSISYYDNDGYYITNDIGDLKIINKEIDFTYKINKNSFRSQHFKKIDENKITILTGGCSHSFGWGLPEELRWQTFLLNNLDNKNLDLFDVSSPGASIRLIIRNVISFIRNYGKPNYIFLMLPDVARDFMYNEEVFNFENVTLGNAILTKKDDLPQHIINYGMSFNEYDAIMRSVEQIWALEEICVSYGIDLYWSTWSYATQDAFHFSDFKFYLEPDWNYFGKMKTSENINNLRYWDYANDKNHFGSSWTSWVGKKFSEKVVYD